MPLREWNNLAGLKCKQSTFISFLTILVWGPLFQLESKHIISIMCFLVFAQNSMSTIGCKLLEKHEWPSLRIFKMLAMIACV